MDKKLFELKLDEIKAVAGGVAAPTPQLGIGDTAMASSVRGTTSATSATIFVKPLLR